MRIRAMDANGDMTFGQGASNFLVNSPQGVGQLVVTNLKLIQGQWFLDTTAGVDYTKVRSDPTQRDKILKAAILGTDFVTKIISYASQFYPAARTFTVEADIDTQFGLTSISVPLVPNVLVV